jgi:hypothetical protein
MFQDQEFRDLVVSHVKRRGFVMGYDHCPESMFFQDLLIPDGFYSGQDG